MKKTYILVLIFFFSYSIKCQEITKDKTTINPIQKFIPNMTYGLSDFCYSLNNYGLIDVPFVIQFKPNNKFIANSGKQFTGEYLTNDSNKIKFLPGIRTLEHLTISINGKKEFCPFLFFDSLIVCNNFEHRDDEFRFYKDKEFKIALKPIYALLPFPERKNSTPNYIKEIRIENSTFSKDFTIIESEQSRIENNVTVNGDSIDFGLYNLIIIKNHCLQEDKSIKNRKLVRRSRKQFKNNNEKLLFPVSFAKLSYNLSSQIRYLDVINTYYKARLFDLDRRGEYSGFLIKKMDSKQLKLEIKYIE